MAKKSQPKRKKETTEKKGFGLNTRQQDILFPVLLTIIMVFLLKPMVIDGLSPQGVDVVASIGANNQVKEFEEESGDRALWNPYLFAGMPRYQRINPVTFSADDILHWLGRLTNNVFIYYLFAALGTYLLLRWLKMRPLVAFLGSLAFVLMPHYKSLYLEGHYTKFRALMMLPWITLTFLYFLEKRTLFAMALFALAFGLQIRTQHYQIVFYSGLLIFSIGVYPILKDALEKNFKRFGLSTLMVFAAVALAVLMAAQPLFNAREYLPYSKRGKTTINLQQPQKTENLDRDDGVSIEYATQWSTAPEEILTWFVPRIFGGMSGEKYEGDAVSQLRGRTIPGYWGEMPFTQSYEYMGVLTLLLALIGIVFNRKKPLIIGLGIFAVFLVLLSFGRHMSWFYSLFYNYVPFFNKFRAPMMSVTVTSFIIALFAAFGLNALRQIFSGNGNSKQQKILFACIGSFIALGIVIFLYGQGAEFVKAGESYQANVQQLISQARQEMFMDDLLRYFLIVLVAGGLLFAYLKRKVAFGALVLAFIVITLVDLVGIRERVSKDYIDRDRLERNYFRATPADRFINDDNDLFRILPVEGFDNNRWAYSHQTVGGYTPIKMYTIEEIVENCIFNGWDQRLPINWNVLEMLNVKYVVMPQAVPHPQLQPAFRDEDQKQFVYRFTDNNARAFFVGQTRVIEDEYDRLRFINSPEFDPDSVAILEQPLTESIAMPDSQKVTVKKFNPNLLSLDVYTDKQSLLVISELHYPPGWHLYIDDREIQAVYKTNHALQSVVIAPGQHSVDLRFEPASYYRNVAYASVSLGIVYLIIAWTLLSGIIRQRKKAAQSGQ